MIEEMAELGAEETRIQACIREVQTSWVVARFPLSTGCSIRNRDPRWLGYPDYYPRIGGLAIRVLSPGSIFDEEQSS